MSLRFHEIAESNHRILNPLTDDKLMLLGEICRLKPEMRQLDLCCGKAEMLCQWSQRWGIYGVGVDISPVFLESAQDRALELGVIDWITLIEGDAGKYAYEPYSYDIVSCLGATWIGGGLVGTLNLMRGAVKPDGLILVGEPFWNMIPSDATLSAMDMNRDDFSTLAGTLDRIESVDLEVVEMVLADTDSWDRYIAAQWMTVDDWLRGHPNDPDAPALRAWIAQSKRSYLEFGRAYLGWGVFVLRSR